jgi:hypothetical protein
VSEGRRERGWRLPHYIILPDSIALTPLPPRGIKLARTVSRRLKSCLELLSRGCPSACTDGTAALYTETRHAPSLTALILSGKRTTAVAVAIRASLTTNGRRKTIICQWALESLGESVIVPLSRACNFSSLACSSYFWCASCWPKRAASSPVACFRVRHAGPGCNEFMR